MTFCTPNRPTYHKRSFGSKQVPLLIKDKSQTGEDFYIEDKVREDPIALTIENEDNFENVVIKEEIKRELRSFRFWNMVIIASFQNVSLLYFYMNFKFIFLKYFNDDQNSTRLATFVEFVGRMAKINSNFIFEFLSLDFVFYGIYFLNFFKNVVFIFYGQSFYVFVPIYILQKILEGLYYIYNFVLIFKCFENKGSFLMKIFELHKFISLGISTIVVYLMNEFFEFEKIIIVLVLVDVFGLVLRRIE